MTDLVGSVAKRDGDGGALDAIDERVLPARGHGVAIVCEEKKNDVRGMQRDCYIN